MPFVWHCIIVTLRFSLSIIMCIHSIYLLRQLNLFPPMLISLAVAIHLRLSRQVSSVYVMTQHNGLYNIYTSGGACSDIITLHGGKHDCEGIVQLLVSEPTDNQSGVLTACSHEFGKEEAQVLCKQLGCPPQGDRVHMSK